MLKTEIKQVTYKQICEWQSANVDFLLVDVREQYEHEDFNIGGQLIPFGDFISKSGELPTDIPVVVYCQKGIRSTIVIQRLSQRQDCSNFYNLEQGIQHLSNKP